MSTPPQLFVRLDTNWVDNPKVIAAGLDGAGLHAAAMCVAKRLPTDGVLHRAQLARLGGTAELIDRLIALGLLDEIDGDRVRIHDWLDANPSRDALAKSARAGNHKRWGHPGPVDKCPKCSPPDRQAIAPGSPPDRPPTTEETPGESPSDRPPIGRGLRGDSEAIGETETETETETDTGKGGTSTHEAARDTAPPRRCKKHSRLPDDAEVPPCGACADARRAHDAWTAAHPVLKPEIIHPPTSVRPPPVEDVLERYRDVPVETNGQGLAAAKAALRRRPAPEPPF